MYQNRIQKLTASKYCDAHLVTSPENLYYFSGFTGGEGALFIEKETRLLFTDSRYTVQAKEQSADFKVIDVAETSLSAFLKKQKPISVGFEDAFYTVRGFAALKKAADHLTWVPATEEMQKIRMIKEKEELFAIAEAARLADDAFSYILTRIAPNRTEKEIALELEFYMREHGAEGLSFETIAASGVRSAMPHGVASDKRLQKNELFTLDFGCKYRGYCSDMTRTVVIGAANEKQKEIYHTVYQAQLAALDKIRAGAAAKDIDAVARNRIKDAGYGDCFGHGLGHSVGLEIHEKPSLSPRSEEILKSGVTMTVEPGIYIAGFGGVRIEDLVVITEDGCKNLVTSPKELIVL